MLDPLLLFLRGPTCSHFCELGDTSLNLSFVTHKMGIVPVGQSPQVFGLSAVQGHSCMLIYGEQEVGYRVPERWLSLYTHTRKSVRPTGTHLPAASFRPNHLGTSEDAFTQPQLKVQFLILNSEAEN